VYVCAMDKDVPPKKTGKKRGRKKINVLCSVCGTKVKVVNSYVIGKGNACKKCYNRIIKQKKGKSCPNCSCGKRDSK
jgi:hypothetical protein